MKTNKDQRQKYTLMKRYNKIWTKIKATTKTKRSSRKRRTLVETNRVKKRSVLGKWKARQVLQKEFVGVQPFIAENKTKLNWKLKTTDAPRKMHNAWSNKNIVFWKVTWFFPMKKGCLGGIPKLWCLYFLDIYWGAGHPQSWVLSIIQLISSFSNPYTWKLTSYKTKHKSISNISVSITMNQPFFASGFNLNHHI
jgi:hypothetical protein